MGTIVIKHMFFFKQKTTYEMRSSDWSSDVCYSDLYHDLSPLLPFQGGGGGGADLRRQLLGPDRLARVAAGHDQDPVDDVAQLPDVAGPVVGLQGGHRVLAEVAHGHAAVLRGQPHEMPGQIGRAHV